MRLANTGAPFGTDVPEARPPVDYVEPAGPTPITNPITLREVRPDEPTPLMFRAQGVETRDARRSIAFFSRTSEGWQLASGDRANGLHQVIARQANGVPQGQQNPWPVAQRSTLFRAPEPWDRGTVRATPTTPAGAAGGFGT